MARVLIVDDEPAIRDTLRAYLEIEGYQVRALADGGRVVEEVRVFAPDVILLDLMLPGMDGIEILQRVRKESAVYVIILSARSDETDRIVGLGVGADDYVVKPFSPREVMARVAAVLRRNRIGSMTKEPLAFSRLEVHPESRTALKEGRRVNLTPIEFDLFYTLASRNGQVLTREELINLAWGNEHFIDVRAVNVHVRRLRMKVEDDPAEPRVIVTVRRAGYRFEAENA